MISGDHSKLQQMIDSFEELAATASAELQALAPTLEQMVYDQFIAETDPYGNAWAELAESTVDKRGSSNPILIDSQGPGNMLGSLKVQALGNLGISLSMKSPAGYHQTGTRYMPQRMIFPKGKNMPPAWTKAFQEAGLKLIRRKLVIK